MVLIEPADHAIEEYMLLKMLIVNPQADELYWKLSTNCEDAITRYQDDEAICRAVFEEIWRPGRGWQV